MLETLEEEWVEKWTQKCNRLGGLGLYANIMDTHTPNQDLHSVRIFNTFGLKSAVG